MARLLQFCLPRCCCCYCLSSTSPCSQGCCVSLPASSMTSLKHGFFHGPAAHSAPYWGLGLSSVLAQPELLDWRGFNTYLLKSTYTASWGQKQNTCLWENRMNGIHIINESLQNCTASNMYGQILFQHLVWLYRLLFHLPSSCLSMAAQMQFFCLSLADTSYQEVMNFSYIFPFSVTLCHSPLSQRFQLQILSPSSCVYPQFESWMCMRLQRKILDLFKIPLKVISTFELNGLFQITYTAPQTSHFKTTSLFQNLFPSKTI